MDLGLLALIFTAALLGPALSLLTRGAVPVVVGQLLAGVILGKTALRIVDPDKSDLVLLGSRSPTSSPPSRFRLRSPPRTPLTPRLAR